MRDCIIGFSFSEFSSQRDPRRVWLTNDRRTKEKNVIKATGMEGKLVEFRAIYENRTDLKRHWTRLEAAFQQDLFPTVEQQKLLAAELMVPYRSIVGWFLRR